MSFITAQTAAAEINYLRASGWTEQADIGYWNKSSIPYEWNLSQETATKIQLEIDSK